MYTFVYVLWRIVSKSYQRVILNCIPMHMCYDILCNCFVLCMQHIYSCLKMFCVLAVVSVLWCIVKKIYTFCGTLALVLFCYLSLTIKQRITLLKNNALICRRPYCTEVFLDFYITSGCLIQRHISHRGLVASGHAFYHCRLLVYMGLQGII